MTKEVIGIMKASSIPERIKAIRAALKLSQRAFAKGVFVSQGYFADIEVGKRDINERIIHLISVIYKVNKEWLKTGKGEMFTTSMTEVKLEHLSGVFFELDELLQDYLIKQADELLLIQKKTENDKGFGLKS
ncbi:MAG: helix-turn-helix domain-containing protein [Treponema sp.]|jgi:transcriptional regulator with XRE-family HTH domain|nr:helix-turn-helix domain-containing protein [Treponema sp.]